MGLNIKNERVHELVSELAARTGMSKTGAIEDAVRRRLDELSRVDEAEIARRKAAIERIVAEVSALPVIGPTYEEIMDDMYDDMGLPR